MTTGWDAERRARVAWSRIAEPLDEKAAELRERHGAVEALDRLRQDPGLAAGRFAPRLAELDLDREEELADRLGITVLVPGDDQWPDGADRLLQPPPCLWVRGSGRLADLLVDSVAVVGARAATAYGTQTAGSWSHALAGWGHTVVSGGAFGIDAAAHRGALAASGRTVAFLAGGVDSAYPRAHSGLLEAVRESGALVSESAPGCSPQRHRFLTRNRLIAAFSTGTLVVEAGARSGSLSTARWADRCSRPVAAVPGPVSSEMSVGTHQLVRDGVAVLVTSPEELLEAVGPMGGQLALPVQGHTLPADAVHPERRWCWEVLSARPATPMAVARAGGRALAETEEALGMLLMAGQAHRVDGGWVRA